MTRMQTATSEPAPAPARSGSTRASDNDVVIIGGGPGGYEAALVAAQLGARVTVVEQAGVGGAAVLSDVVPSKTLIATADVMTLVDDAPDLGVLFPSCEGEVTLGEGLHVDLDRVNTRVRALAQAQSRDVHERLENEGVRIVTGTGRLLGPSTVQVTEPSGATRTKARMAFLAQERARCNCGTGTVPRGRMKVCWRAPSASW